MMGSCRQHSTFMFSMLSNLAEVTITVRDHPFPASDCRFDAAPTTSPRYVLELLSPLQVAYPMPSKRVRRSNPVVHSDDEAGSPNVRHEYTPPPTAPIRNHVEPEGSQDDLTPVSEHASDSYDYEGVDMDEYDASFMYVSTFVQGPLAHVFEQ
jgi:hypothetical protein